MIDPKSIKVVPTYAEILIALRKPGATIRSVAVDLGTHTRKVGAVRMENSELFPKKDKVSKPKKTRKIPGARRWITVPKDVDTEISESAERRGLTWQEQANLIFREWRNEQ